MHATVVEVVALQPPRVHEHLPPLFLGIHRELQVREVDLAVIELRLLIRRCGDHIEVSALVNEKLRPVRRELVIAYVLDQRLRLRVLIIDIERHQAPRPFTIRLDRLEEETIAVRGELAVVARLDRDFEEARRDAVQIDRHANRLVIFLFFVTRLVRIVRVQFVFGLEGPAGTVLKRDPVKLGLVCEERLGLSRAPGTPYERVEVSIGQEEDPFPVPAPSGTVAVVAVCCYRDAGFVLDVIDINLPEGVVRRPRVGEPAAVEGPTDAVIAPLRREIDPLRRPGLDVIEPELLIVVVGGEIFPVWRGDSVVAQHLAVAADLRGCPHAVRRDLPPLHLTGLVRHHDQLVFAQEAGVAITHILPARRLHEATLLDRRHENLSSHR